MKKLLLAFALLAAFAGSASAQCNGVFANNTVCGNATGSANLPRPTSPASFQGSAGGSNGQIQYNSSGALAGATGGDVQMSGTTTLIQPAAVTNAKLATGAANTIKGSINGTTTSDLAIASCSVAYRFTQWVSGTGWQCGISPILPSRATAASLDLSAFSAITTQGYATPGDGGGATFKNVATAAFIDSGVASGAVSAGGTCTTNGTFYGVSPTGGTGVKLQGIVVIAGGIMTSFTPTGTKGNAYTAADVLTIPNGTYNGATLTCSVSPTWTVSTVSTPTASFTDTASNHWQYVVDAGNYPNTRQFGAKLDRAGKANDGLATDDKTATQNALNFAWYGISTSDVGGSNGIQVIVPAGTSLICNGLMVPSHIFFRGVSNAGTTLKQCDADANTQNFITLGDYQNHQTAHFVGIGHMTLFGANASTSGTVAMVYSNSANSNWALYDVSIYPIYRGCVYTETGYGGPNIFRISGMYCVPNSAVTPFGVSLQSASNHVIDGGSWFSAGGSPWGGNAITVNTNAGIINRFVDVHCENLAVCAYVNVAAGGVGTMTHVVGMTGNATVTYVVSRPAGTATGQLKVETSAANGAGCVVNNGGACTTGNLLAATIY